MHKERNSENTELARCKIMARLLNDFNGYLQLDCSFLFAGTCSINTLLVFFCRLFLKVILRLTFSLPNTHLSFVNLNNYTVITKNIYNFNFESTVPSTLVFFERPCFAFSQTRPCLDFNKSITHPNTS